MPYTFARSKEGLPVLGPDTGNAWDISGQSTDPTQSFALFERLKQSPVLPK
jgi:hypothetical protein